jgi:hypothetical protein
MGGIGSGWHRGARPRCERRTVAIDLAMCKLEPGARMVCGWNREGEQHGISVEVNAAGVATVEYFSADKAGRYRSSVADEQLTLHDVPQHFGGVRRLVGCPGCRRRCRILYFDVRYLYPRLRCHICLGLRYHSQSLQRIDRAHARAAKICRRVDPKAKLLSIDEFPPKPPRMRWATYERLEDSTTGRQRS